MDQVSDIFIVEMCKKAESYGLFDDEINRIMRAEDYDGKINDLAKIIRGIRDFLNDEYMGFSSHPAPKGTFYYAVRLGMLAANLEGFLSSAHNFYFTFSPAMNNAVEINAESFTSKFTLHNPELDPSGVFRLYMLMSIHRLSSWITGKRIPLQTISFDCPPNAGLEDYQKAFDCPIHFSANVTSISFPKKYLAYPCIRSEADLIRYVDRRPLDILTIPGEDDSISQRVKQVLYAEQADGNRLSTLDELAKDFHISQQTLRRKLANESTNYRELKDTVRRDIVMETLATTKLPLAEVAVMAGFQETNSFFRAFKRWADISPSEYREKYSR